jgi:uncharacterized protein DUF1573
MRTVLLFSVLFCALAVGRNFAVVYGPSWWRPEINCPAPEVHLGRVNGGVELDYAFDVFNSGGKALVIKRVTAECGCTSLARDLIDRSVEPGRHETIAGKLRVPPMVGEFRKSIVVESDDPRRPVLRLQLVGSVSD